MLRTTLGDKAFTLEHALDDLECQHWIDWSEAKGYQSAPVTTRNGPVHLPEVRNNDRVMVDAPEIARGLWERIRHTMPHRPGWAPVGLNERLRFYRYDPGQRFAMHRDGSFVRSESERSFLTLLFYLNDNYHGGQTRLLTYDVAPKRGMALIFDHRLLHEGVELTQGRKYVLRSDVMYRRT